MHTQEVEEEVINFLFLFLCVGGAGYKAQCVYAFLSLMVSYTHKLAKLESSEPPVSTYVLQGGKCILTLIFFTGGRKVIDARKQLPTHIAPTHWTCYTVIIMWLSILCIIDEIIILCLQYTVAWQRHSWN